jgi:hypothetical protein
VTARERRIAIRQLIAEERERRLLVAVEPLKKQIRREDLEKTRARKKRWNTLNQPQRTAYMRRWREKNREHYNTYMRELRRKKVAA